MNSFVDTTFTDLKSSQTPCIEKNGKLKAAFVLDQDAFEDVFGSSALEALGTVADVLGPPLTSREFLETSPEWMREVQVLFTGWGSPRLDPELISRMPSLRAVFHGAGSLRGILTEEIWPEGILFCSAASFNAIPTSEYAFGAILLSLKRAWSNAQLIKTERTYTTVKPPTLGGVGTVVGLTSLGQIGRRVAAKLQTVDVKVLAFDPYAPDDLFSSLRVTRCENLEALFSRSRIVSLHTPLLPQTKGMIDRSLLNLLPRFATLINTARGGLIREDDLIQYLREHPEAQAVLDVTEPEPPAPDSPFWELPNVFLTPHVAGALGPECRRMGQAMLDEYQRYILNQPLCFQVSPEQFPQMA